MAERLTTSAARNVFYGGSAFFFAIFLGFGAVGRWLGVGGLGPGGGGAGDQGQDARQSPEAKNMHHQTIIIHAS